MRIIGYFVVALLTGFSITNASLVEQYSEKYNIQIQPSATVNTSFPSQPTIQEDLHGSADDLSTLVSVKLPDSKDHHTYGYLYSPKLDIIAPIHEPSQEDKKKIFFGKNFDHFPYLEQGMLHYYGESPVFGAGNMVLAVHSSYKHDDPGRFKTIGQIIPLHREGDILHYYQKNISGNYDFFQYRVKASYETTPDDISILSQGLTKELTAYTCYPIGTTTNRRVFKSDMIAHYKNHTTLEVFTPQKQSSIQITTKEKQPPLQHSSASQETVSSLPTTPSNESDTMLYHSLTQKLLGAKLPSSTMSKYKPLLPALRIALIKPAKQELIKVLLKQKVTSLVKDLTEKKYSDTSTKIEKIIHYIVLYRLIDDHL